MMTEMKNWLSSIRESEEIMDRIDPIPTAMLPAPRIEPPPPDEETEALAHAAKLVEGFKTQRAQLEAMLAEATRALKDRNREVELLGLDLAQAKNDLQTLAADLETRRQEVSDLRAFFASMRAQMDHFEIPLPVRKRTRNGKNSEVKTAAAA